MKAMVARKIDQIEDNGKAMKKGDLKKNGKPETKGFEWYRVDPGKKDNILKKLETDLSEKAYSKHVADSENGKRIINCVHPRRNEEKSLITTC